MAITESLVLAVLDNGAVPVIGLVHPHVAVVSDEGQQLVEDPHHVSQHGCCTCDEYPATWRDFLVPTRRPVPGPAGVVFGMTRQTE